MGFNLGTSKEEIGGKLRCCAPIRLYEVVQK